MQSFDVLSSINEARQSHGLRHQDYERYRQYCTRKIQRVRKSLGIQQSAKTQLKMESLTDLTPTHLEILLFQSERAWSYAMQIKSKLESHQKHHFFGRLKRSVAHASQLFALCDAAHLDNRSKLEINAYMENIKGVYALEKQEYNTAIDHFITARVVYDVLSVSGSSHQKALAMAALDAVDPNLRFCAYTIQLGGSEAVEISALVLLKKKQLSEKLSKLDIEATAMITSTVEVDMKLPEWRGATLNLDNPLLREAYFKAQKTISSFEKTLSKEAIINEEKDKLHANRLASFDIVIGSLWDVTEISEKEYRDVKNASAQIQSSKAEQSVQRSATIHAYFSWLRSEYTIKRNLFLIQSAREQKNLQQSLKADSLVKLYDDILLIVNEVIELQGVQSDVYLRQCCQVKSAFFNASRHLALAQLQTIQQKFKQAHESLLKATESSHTAKLEVSHLESISRKKTKISLSKEELDQTEMLVKDVDDLCVEIGKTIGIHKAKSYMYNKKASHPKKAPMAERLDEFDDDISFSNPNLIDVDPKIEPIAFKPIYYDIAGNYIDYPLARLEARLGITKSMDIEGEDVSPKEDKKGLMGLVSSIFGSGR